MASSSTQSRHSSNARRYQDLTTQWVDWYEANARELPWRNTREPYKVWLSEVMLQQTQVKTVLPYYERFLEQFPTVQDLAKADTDTVMKAWEGLGYYSRSRNLHKASKIVVEEFGGVFPSTLEEMLALPGIGRSTAGAILTFSDCGKYPILDGNVKRVFSRLLDIDELITKPEVEKTLWAFSQNLINATGNAYSLNQGLMELGATLCVTNKPQCLICPIQNHCLSFQHGTQHERPIKASKVPTPHKTIAVGVIWNDKNQVLVQRRPDDGLLGGLWEFPGGKQEPGETLEETVQREVHEELGINIEVNDKIIAVKHAYSHFKITLHAYHCQYVSGEPTPTAASAWQWVALEDINELGFPKANKKVLACLFSD